MGVLLYLCPFCVIMVFGSNSPGVSERPRRILTSLSAPDPLSSHRSSRESSCRTKSARTHRIRSVLGFVLWPGVARCPSAT